MAAIVAIRKICDDLICPAKRTFFVLLQRKYIEDRVKGVIDEKTAYQGISPSQDEFEGLGSLDQADLPGHNSQDTYLASGGNEVFPGGGRHHAPQARPSSFRVEDGGLSFKTNRCAKNIGFPREERGIV